MSSSIKFLPPCCVCVCLDRPSRSNRTRTVLSDRDGAERERVGTRMRQHQSNLGARITRQRRRPELCRLQQQRLKRVAAGHVEAATWQARVNACTAAGAPAPPAQAQRHGGGCWSQHATPPPPRPLPSSFFSALSASSSGEPLALLKKRSQSQH